MGVDGFVPLALEGGDDRRKAVAGARAGELEGTFDGRSAGGWGLQGMAFRAASGSFRSLPVTRCLRGTIR
jgi:hypothetical protein